MPPRVRLHVLSDVHVDFPENRRDLPELAREMAGHAADAFVLAGDVSHKPEHVDESLRILADLAKTRLFVAGNHDVWIVREARGGPADSWGKLDALGDLCRSHGYRYLERENVRVGGFTFVGTIGWYDYSFASPRLALPPRAYEKKRWRDLTYMDREYARWGAPDEEVVERLVEALGPRLAAAEPPIVFVSHHVPLEELVLRRGVDSWDFFNAYMGSRRIEALVRERQVERFVFGHTHRLVARVEAGRCAINNAVGYPRERLEPERTPFEIT